ncbi:hypothetical protein Q7C_192 [Methylophaga frappieri]|jgi:hypothetical protein|uniref:DUF4412 domain-containing protein n=1 Tax=Methylophaga frappieri (strain ATCC BAA-2434 / DSM 25690 / JAM7) TaxID=754477 RepID=I1YEN0_METFJ|nr:hypothetical protein [Methylophaga frappieri]AFJ01373.1 hypothetical protein Q7C_192 [Methylophaga frappieri]
MQTRLSTFSLTAASLLLLTHTAIADTRAVYEGPDGKFIIEYQDDNHMRFATGDDTFMLISGGEPYMISRDNGNWTAMSAKGMAGMLGKQAEKKTRLTPMGQSETIAGYSGERYRVEVGDDWSGEWKKQSEVVLSKSADTLPTMQAMRRLVEVFGGKNMTNFDQVEGIDVSKYGMLVSDEMRLVSLSTDDLSDGIFQLPPGVQVTQMPDIFGQMNKSTDAASGTAESGQGSGFLSDLLSETQQEAADQTKQGTKEGVGDVIREGIRGLFN